MQGRLSPLYENKIQCFPKMHWEGEFSIANSIGFPKMEWTLDHDDLIKNPLLRKSGQKKISLLCEKYDLSIPSVTGDCFMQKPYWKEEDQNIKLRLDKNFNLICKSCRNLNISYLVIPLVDNGKLENQFQEEILLEWLISKYPILKECRLQILFESDYEPNKLKSFINELRIDIFGINYDIGNSAALGYDIDYEFDSYGERIKNVHVKDRLLGGNSVPLGEGCASFKKVFKRLSDISYSGNFILQTARSIDEQHSLVLQKYGIIVNNLINEFKIGI